jgi:hypothetical protein
MSLSKNDAAVLQEIVELEGSCLRKERCLQCPFRSMCLPEFLNPFPPTKSQRFNIALDVLTHNALMDPEKNIEHVKIGRNNSKHIN